MPDSNDKVLKTLEEAQKTIGKINDLISKRAKVKYELSPTEIQIASILAQLAKALQEEIEAHNK